MLEMHMLGVGFCSGARQLVRLRPMHHNRYKWQSKVKSVHTRSSRFVVGRIGVTVHNGLANRVHSWHKVLGLQLLQDIGACQRSEDVMMQDHFWDNCVGKSKIRKANTLNSPSVPNIRMVNHTPRVTPTYPCVS